MMRSASGQSTNSKGKGKCRNKTVSGGDGESDSSPDVANGDDDYIVRTDHLVNSTDAAK
jgi:peroxin-6